MHRFPGLQIYGKCIKKKELCSEKNKIITRRNGDEMEDYSIANTTKEQRIALIRQWIPDEDGLGDSGEYGSVGYLCRLYQRKKRNC